MRQYHAEDPLDGSTDKHKGLSMSAPETPIETNSPEADAERRPPRARRLGLLIGLALAATVVFLLASANSSSLEREAEAASRLRGLGAIVVMDAQRRHVASVNLSLAKDLAAALSELQVCSRIEALDLGGADPRPEDVQAISKLISLKSLTLNSTPVEDADIGTLTSLRELESLQLGNTSITGVALAAIGRMPALKVLDLSRTSVDSGLAELAKPSGLEWIVLREVTLEPGALPELAGCRSLKTLTLQGSTYGEEDLRSLLATNSGIRVER